MNRREGGRKREEGVRGEGRKERRGRERERERKRERGGREREREREGKERGRGEGEGDREGGKKEGRRRGRDQTHLYKNPYQQHMTPMNPYIFAVLLFLRVQTSAKIKSWFQYF